MDKHKSKVDLRAAGKKRLEEFRQKKQNKESHAKSSDKSKNFAEEASSMETATDLDQKPKDESSNVAFSKRSDSSESSNQEGKETGKVEQTGGVEGKGLHTDRLSMDEVSSSREQFGLDSSVDLAQHRRKSSESSEEQGKFTEETDVAVNNNMSDSTIDMDSSIIEEEVVSRLTDITLSEQMNTSGSSNIVLGTEIESRQANPSSLEEEIHVKSAGEDIKDERVTPKSDAVHDSEQLSYRSSDEGALGENLGAHIIMEGAWHALESLSSGRQADQEIGPSELDQQQNRDGVSPQATQVYTEGSLVLASTCHPQPSPTGLLYQLDDEGNTAVAVGESSVDALDRSTLAEGQNTEFEHMRLEMERLVHDRERLLSELGACRDSLMQTSEENGQLTDKLNSHQLREEQLEEEKSLLEVRLQAVINENFTLQTDFEASRQKLHETQEHENLLRAERSANKELVQENAKLITEIEQLKQKVCNMEQDKFEMVSASDQFRAQLQAGTEEMAFLSEELDNARQKLCELIEERGALSEELDGARQKLHELIEERGTLTGRMETMIIEMENVKKEKVIGVDELKKSQLQESNLLDSENRSALEIATLHQKLKELEAEKVIALSKMRTAQQNLFVEDSGNVKEAEQIEEPRYNELCLTVEFERFTKEAKEREDKFLNKLENLRNQLEFMSNEKESLLMQLDEQAKMNMETEQNYLRAVNEMAEMRVLIHETCKEKDCLVGNLEQYKLELSALVIEKEEFKSEALSAGDQIEELRVQTCLLKDELQQIQKDKSQLMVQLDDYKVLLEKLRDEKEELLQNLFSTRDKMEQIRYKADLQEKLVEERNHLAKERDTLSAELHECKECLLRAQDAHVQHENELREVTLQFQKVLEENTHLSSSLHEHKRKLAKVEEEFSWSISEAKEAKDQLQKLVNRNDSLDHEFPLLKNQNREQATKEGQVAMQMEDSELPMNQQVQNLCVENPQIITEHGTGDRECVSALEASLNQVQELFQEKSQLTSQPEAKEQQLFYLHEELARAQQELTAVLEHGTNLHDSRPIPSSMDSINDSHKLIKDGEQVNDLDRVHEHVSELERENDNLLQEIDKLKNCLREVQHENSCFKDQYGSIQQQLQALEAFKMQSLAEISRLEEQLQKGSSTLMQDLEVANCQLEELQQENAHLQQKYSSVLQQFQDLEVDRTQLGAEINRLKEQLHTSAEVSEAVKYQLLEVEKDKARLVTDLELTKGQLEELDVSNKLEKTVLTTEVRDLLQQITKQDSDHADKVSVLKARLNEAELTSQKLEKAVREMFPDSSSLSKASGKVAPGVSKLIRAFEAKAQHEDVTLEGEPYTETEHNSGESLEKVGQESDATVVQDVNVVLQQLREAEDDIRFLRVTLSQLERDADMIKHQLEEEQEEKRHLTAALRQLEVDVDTLKLEKDKQEEKMATLIEKNEHLMAESSTDSSQIEALHAQLQYLEKQACEKSATMQNQVEQVHRESAEKASSLEAEKNSYVVAMIHAAEKLEGTIQHVSSNSSYHLDPSSVDVWLASVVNATIEKINELRNLEVKLEMSCHANSEIQTSFGELTQKFAAVQEQRDSAVRELYNTHNRLRKLIKQQERMNEASEHTLDRLRHVERKEAEEEGQNALSVLPLDFLSDELESFVEELQESLEERLQFETTIRELESALFTKDQDIQNLNAKCVELSKKCVEKEKCGKCAALDEVCASMTSQAIEHAIEKDALYSELDVLQRAFSEQEKVTKATSEAHSKLNWHLETMSEKLIDAVEEAIQDKIMVTDSDRLGISHLETCILFLIEKYKASLKQIKLFQKCIAEFASKSENSGEEETGRLLDVALREAFSCKEMELHQLREKLDEVHSIRTQQKEEIRDLKERLHKMEEELNGVSMEKSKIQMDFEQTEQKLSSVREKLSMAVSKGKGLVQQRDALKQTLAGKSTELERCWQELQTKNVALNEAETKLKSYGEAGERVEALESELAYIRNSATALRESFLHKDSVLQKIEEILEDFNFPEQFYSKEIIEKIEWLARSCSVENAPLLGDWDQKISERDNEDDADFQVSKPRLDVFNFSQNQQIEDLRRKHEELQGKYFSLAEQSDMLEQSLLERNHLIQRWEEVLDSVDMPVSMRSMEPEDRIEWLGRALTEAQQDSANAQHQIENGQRVADLLAVELQDSGRKILMLDADLSTERHEKELLSKSLQDLSCKYESLTEQASQAAFEKENLLNELSGLQAKFLEQESNMKSDSAEAEGVIRRLVDMVGETLQHQDLNDLSSSCSSENLEGCLRKLIDTFNALSEEVRMHRGTEDANILCGIMPSPNAEEVQTVTEALEAKEQELIEMSQKLEESISTGMAHKSERDKLIEQCRAYSEEIEAMKNQRDALQIQLEQAEEKLSSTREKLSMAVKKGKGLVQQRESLKQSVDEKIAEVEQLKRELKGRDCAIDESEQKIRNLSSALEHFEMLESEVVFSRDHASEVEQSLLESNRMIQRLMTALDAIDVTGKVQFRDPVEEIEWLGKSFQELQGKLVSAEQEIKKSKRAADLLAIELDEVHARMDNLEDELAKSESEVLTLAKEKNAAEAGKVEATLRLECVVAAQAEELNQAFDRINKQNSALINLRAGIECLRKEHGHLLPLLANDFFKKLELLRGLEISLQRILNQLASSKGSKMPCLSTPVGDLHEEGKYLPSEAIIEAHPEERADHLTEQHVTYGEQMADELLGSLAHELQGCMGDLEILKERFEGQSAAFNQKGTGMSQLFQIAVEEVMNLVESLESLKWNASSLEALNQEKESEIFMLHRNISILYDACSSAVAELKILKAQIPDVDSQSSGRHATVATSSMQSASENPETLHLTEQLDFIFTDKFSMETAEKLLLSVKEFVSAMTEKSKYDQKELSLSILQLQHEAEAKEAEKFRVFGELQSQIKGAKAVANSLSRERDIDKARICDLEKQIEKLQEECHALAVTIEDFRSRDASVEEMQQDIASLNKALSTKNQELEGLMQALDEAELQMETLSSKVEELEDNIQQKQAALENLESSRGKAVAKLSSTVSRLEDLRQLSEGLLAEVENLQVQLESRDAEISRLRQEVTRCTNDVLASQENMKRKNIEIRELQARLETIISNVGVHDKLLEEKEVSRTHVLLGALEKRIATIMSESEGFRLDSKSKDVMLQDTQNKMEHLLSKVDLLEASLHEKQTQVERLQGQRGSGLGGVAAGPEVSEIEETGQISKRSIPSAPVAPHVRNTKKVSNDQLALNIDIESGQSTSDLEDESKGHVFKSLTTSRLIPKTTRPIADRIDGIWVSGGRVLMRRPTARLGLIVYWIVLHLWIVTMML